MALSFVKLAVSSSSADFFNSNKTEIAKIMRCFVALHEYLYKQQIMKMIVELHNAIAVKISQKDCHPKGAEVLKKSVLNILSENSKTIPEFRMFITYQGFFKKIRYLIDLIKSAIPTKKNLLKCLDHINGDAAYPTHYKKYEKLVERLYDALWVTYNAVAGLSDEDFPDKWDKFHELLVIISYLNSSENPFARQNPGQPEKYGNFHKKALEHFAMYQDSLTDEKSMVLPLSDESLKAFHSREMGVLSVKIKEMSQGGLNNGPIMQALSMLPSDDLLLPYLGEPTNPGVRKGTPPAAPKGAALVAPAAAKYGVFPAPGKNPPPATGRELVPATNNQGTNTASPENKDRDCRMM